MARMKVEEMMEKKVNQLREAEKEKNEELSKIQKELRRFETAL
jgi:chaperonin cofactor prefoldin